MTDRIEQHQNKVLAFYDRLFNQCQPAEAIEQYVGDVYLQHNPAVTDGKEACIGYFTHMVQEYPGERVHVKRVIAGHSVVLYCYHQWPDDGDWAGINIVRQRNTKGDKPSGEAADVLPSYLGTWTWQAGGYAYSAIELVRALLSDRNAHYVA